MTDAQDLIHLPHFDPDLWGGWDQQAQSVQPEPLGDFWSARPSLSLIHTFARARRVAPWATLGAVLARVVASTEPAAQLPPTIGSYASLNLFVGLVGPSGAGKDAATKVARDAVDLAKGNAFLTAPLGSGEGLSHMFMKDNKGTPEQYNEAALVTIGEIDTLGALVQRQSSTVGSQLRQAAMGEQLGFFYVDAAKRMVVPEHRYRMCLIAGIQPKRAGVLLGEADGGTPQRFVWLPATDPDAPDVAPPCPPPLLWCPPRWHEANGQQVSGQYRNPVKLPDVAVETVVAAHLARTRGQGDALDGHALLTRLKVSTALAILEGRFEVDETDWDLSEMVMAVSDETRKSVVKVLAEETKRTNKAQAEAEAARTIVVQDRVDEARVRRVANVIKGYLSRNGGSATEGEIRRKAIANRDRDYLVPALDALVRSGQVDREKVSYQGQPGDRYVLTGATS